MSRQDHVADTALASAIMDAGSPQEAKRLVENFRRDVWNQATEAVAVFITRCMDPATEFSRSMVNAVRTELKKK